MRVILLLATFLLSTIAWGQDSIPHKSLKDLNFRSIGPAGMSGRITAIKVDPRNENIIYAGSASGGLWFSNNGGTSWNCIFNNEAVSSVGAIALDPHNPDIIWLGTGEGNPRNSNTGGAGLYKSIDGGKSWTLMGLESTRHIHRVIVHPHSPNIVYVAAIGNPWADSESRGVYKTIDGGDNWERILYKNERTGAAEMVMDPVNPEKLIVNMWEHRREPWFFKSGGEGSGLFITYDGGKTWKQKDDKHGLPKGELGRMGIAIAASQPNRVYAYVEKKGKNALYRSENGGENWKMISTDPNIGNRPFYYAEIYVDPQNENRVYSIWSVISRSEDGGKSWSVIAPYNYIHPDHHAFFIHPQNPSYILNGNDGGLNISRDRGNSWRFVNNLPLGQFYHISYDMDFPYNVYGGMQDNGSWKGPAYVFKSDGIRSDYWQELYFGDGFDVLPDLPDSRFVFAMSQEGYVGRVDTRTGYTKMVRPVHPEHKKLRFNWNAPIARNTFNTDLYFGAQYVFRSKNNGNSWSVISPDLTSNDSTKQNFGESGGLTFDVTGAENYTTLLCIEPVALATNPVGIWVSSDDGKLHLTKNGGDSWDDLSGNLKGMPVGAWIPQVVSSKYKEGEAFVVANDYRRGDEQAMLFYTSNYGKSFTNIGKDLPAYVLSVVQDHKNANLIFAGTQRGLFFSWDKGQHWQKWSKDFPTVPVSDLKIHPREDDLIVGTFGRSIYILDQLDVLRQQAEKSSAQDIGKWDLMLDPVYYKIANLRADGSRFPADGIFKGDNRSRALMAFVYNGFSTEDSVKTKKVKFEILNSAGETVGTLFKTPKEGLGQYDLYMRGKGLGFPSKDRKLSDTSEVSSLSLPCGSYTLVSSYAGQSSRKQFEYLCDPRLMPKPRADSLLINFNFRYELDSSLANLHQATNWIKKAKAKLKLAEGLAELELSPAKRKTFTDSLKPLHKGLKSLEEQVYGREVDGYYDQPLTLQSKYYSILNYFGRSWEGVPSQAVILEKDYRQTEAKFLADWKKWETGEWTKFDGILVTYNLKL